MAPPIWLHCNVCHDRQTKSWHISSCGRVICQDCLPGIKTTPCKDCRGPCIRTVELNSKAPKDVQKLFGDVSEDVKAVSKIIAFQERHKANFLMAKKRKLDSLAKEQSKMEREKKRKLSEIEETKARLASVQSQIEKKKKATCVEAEANPTNPWRKFTAAASAAAHCTASFFRTEAEVISVAPPPNFPPIFSPITSPRSETRGPRFQTSTPRHRTRNHSLDGDFMKLKTPAVWNRQGGRRRREGSADRRSLDRQSLDRSRAESARTKSPVEKALDELLEDSPIKNEERSFGRNPVSSFFSPTYYHQRTHR